MVYTKEESWLLRSVRVVFIVDTGIPYAAAQDSSLFALSFSLSLPLSLISSTLSSRRQHKVLQHIFGVAYARARK